MWGILSYSQDVGYGIGVTIIDDPVVLGVGIPTAVLILITGLGGVFLGYKVQKGEKELEAVAKIWMLLGIISIIAPIVYLATMTTTMYGIIPVSFGGVGPFIGGALLILSGAVVEYT